MFLVSFNLLHPVKSFFSEPSFLNAFLMFRVVFGVVVMFVIFEYVGQCSEESMKGCLIFAYLHENNNLNLVNGLPFLFFLFLLETLLACMIIQSLFLGAIMLGMPINDFLVN